MENLNDPKYNFDELVKLASKHPYATFAVTGDYTHIVVREKAHNFLYVLSFCIILGISIACAATQSSTFMACLVLFGLLTALVLYIRYSPTTNTIEINSYSKTIKIISNNFFGKHIIPQVEISFREFSGFSYKEIVLRKGKYNNLGTADRYNRIYIHYNDRKHFFIELPKKTITWFSVDHRKFMDCLTRIIKNDA
jgi:hypothetical protein